ncbi:hypothetical protein D3C85_580930 [compost metagenome]
MRLGGDGPCGLADRPEGRGARRRLRGRRPQPLPHEAPAARRRHRRGHRHRRHAGPHERQLRRLAVHARGLQARPARPGPERADRMLDLAGGRAPGLPGPAEPRLRHGAGRRRVAQPAAGGRLPLPERRHPLARRPLPRLRRPGRGHGDRQRRGHRRAAPAGRRAARRRHHPRRHQGHGRQQRRRRQDRLHRTERAGPGRRDPRGAADGRRARAHHRLCRGARHGHHAGRPDRAGRAHAGLPCRWRRWRALRLLRHRLGQDQHRPPRRGGRRGRAHQGDAGAAPPHAAAEPALRAAEPADRFREQPVPREHRSAPVARGRHAAPCGRQLFRHRRHQRARRARRGAARGHVNHSDWLAGAAAVDPQRVRDATSRAATGRSPARAPRVAARRHRPHPASGPPCLRAPQRRGGRPCRRGRAAALGGRGPGRARRARAGARGGLPLPRRRHATRANGPRALRGRRGLPRRHRPLLRAAGTRAGLRPAHRAVPRARR